MARRRTARALARVGELGCGQRRLRAAIEHPDLRSRGRHPDGSARLVRNDPCLAAEDRPGRGSGGQRAGARGHGRTVNGSADDVARANARHTLNSLLDRGHTSGVPWVDAGSCPAEPAFYCDVQLPVSETARSLPGAAGGSHAAAPRRQRGGSRWGGSTEPPHRQPSQNERRAGKVLRSPQIWRENASLEYRLIFQGKSFLLCESPVGTAIFHLFAA